MGLDRVFKKRKQKMRSSAIYQHKLHISSEDEVFDILKPGQEEGTYNNPLMDCSSMGEYLDVLSAHDRLKDGKALETVHLQTPADCQSLDLGFPLSDDDQMTDIHNQPESDVLDMEFPTSSDNDRSNGETLDLGFPPESNDAAEPLDLGFDVDLAPQPANILDMGDSAGTTGMLLHAHLKLTC
ncbi:hypothetical protein EDB19DRAFT_1918075 [Suillus lakei]|nr:hypothetical protein EDB19DRAFT_1918075 [Suillus lakei]